MIRILDTQTANAIAAGEVVERPASVVKELLENALDAGASVIKLQIDNGGIRRIQVQDNGCGMESQDAALAFERHATSKLRQIGDLDHLHSMGFRGEALASIAAVSKVDLRSKRLGSEGEGHQVRIHGGELLRSGSIGCPEGTQITVEELFYNTPARYKFLKRDSTEAGYIQDLVIRMAFARPDVSFHLQKDQEMLLMTPGNNDLQSVVYTVWGKEVAEHCRKVQGQSEGMEVTGLLADAKVARKNRSRQVFIVNGRVIQSKLLSAAVTQACHGIFVKGQFAQLVLKLRLPASQVDVNVHPQKTELRFADEQAVFRLVYHALKESMDVHASIPEEAIKERVKEAPPVLPEAKAQQMLLPELSALPIEKQGYARTERVPPMHQALFFQERHQADVPQKPLAEKQSKASEATAQTAPALMQARLIGQVFETYLLLEGEACLFLIDQHAAHERILYERLLQADRRHRDKPMQSQSLMSPIDVPLSLREKDAIEAQREAFTSLGFSFEAFGRQSVLLRAIPAEMAEGNHAPDKAFLSLVDRAVMGRLAVHEDREELLHDLACKAAIKAHDRLSYDEMMAVVQQLQGLEDPYHCPHGRPVIIQLSQREIEKMFKRIV